MYMRVNSLLTSTIIVQKIKRNIDIYETQKALMQISYNEEETYMETNTTLNYNTSKIIISNLIHLILI